MRWATVEFRAIQGQHVQIGQNLCWTRHNINSFCHSMIWKWAQVAHYSIIYPKNLLTHAKLTLHELCSFNNSYPGNWRYILGRKYWFSLALRKVMTIISASVQTSSVRELQSSSVSRSRTSDLCDGASFWGFRLCCVKCSSCFITVRVWF